MGRQVLNYPASVDGHFDVAWASLARPDIKEKDKEMTQSLAWEL